tara:strand:- start:20681 stop:20950 length:270 start_codon:yes stop_codon:yes gene_type:complete
MTLTKTDINSKWYSDDMALCIRYGFIVYPILRSPNDTRVYLEMKEKGYKKRLPDLYEQGKQMADKVRDIYRQKAEKIRIRLSHSTNQKI